MAEGGPVDVALLATTAYEFPIHLARALRDLGCRVGVAAPRRSVLLATSSVAARACVRPTRAVTDLTDALERFSPTLVVPCDDATARHLDVVRATAPRWAPLLETSLGVAEHRPVVHSRNALTALAATAGIATPAAVIVEVGAPDAAAVASRAAHELGWPVVLKRDGAGGGVGVAIVDDPEQLPAAWARMAAPPTVGRRLARVWRDRNLASLTGPLSVAPESVAVQAYVAGEPLTVAAACWRGEVLAASAVAVLESLYPTGPATLVRTTEQPDASEAVVKIVRALEISGLIGVDFMIDPATGAALLLEVNPRATPIAAFPLPDGDPAAAIAGAAGVAAPTRAAINGTLAMFPGEWIRPGGDPLAADHRLIPDDEPDLVARCLPRGA